MKVTAKNIGDRIYDETRGKFGIVSLVEYGKENKLDPKGEEKPIRAYYIETDENFDPLMYPQKSADGDITYVPVLQVIEVGVKIVLLVDSVWPILKKWFRDIFGSKAERLERSKARKARKEKVRKREREDNYRSIVEGLSLAKGFFAAASSVADIVLDTKEEEPSQGLSLKFPYLSKDTDRKDLDGRVFVASFNPDDDSLIFEEIDGSDVIF
jgi:hypothetical protein